MLRSALFYFFSSAHSYGVRNGQTKLVAFKEKKQEDETVQLPVGDNDPDWCIDKKIEFCDDSHFEKQCPKKCGVRNFELIVKSESAKDDFEKLKKKSKKKSTNSSLN